MSLDLTNHESNGTWLQEGRYLVTITDFEKITANSGTTGVSYTFEDEAGSQVRGSYWTHNKDGSESKACWKLNALAKAAKLSEKDMKKFDLPMLKGKLVIVSVVPGYSDPKFCEVGESYPPDLKMDLGESKSATPEAKQPINAGPLNDTDDGSVPF